MPYCVVKQCKNTSAKHKNNTGLSFHKFPIQWAWRNKWIEAIRASRKDASWLPSKCSILCSTHFDDTELYTTQSGLRRVIKYAVPSKMLGDHLQNEDLEQINVSTQTLDLRTKIRDHETMIDPIATYGNVTAFCTTVLLDKPESPQVSSRTSPVQEDFDSPWANNDSDLESAFDNSERSELRNQLRKKTKMLKICRIKIKTLNQRLRRLQKKNQSLGNIIKELQNK